MLLFCHPFGGPAVRHAAVALNEAGLLGEFWTCVHTQPTALLRRLMPEPVVRQFTGQRFPLQLAGRVRAAPLEELSQGFGQPLAFRRLIRRGHDRLAVVGVQQGLDRRASERLCSDGFTGVYAYEGGATALFRAAQQRHLPRLYDVPNGYARRAQALFDEEALLAPRWAGAETPRHDGASLDAHDAELALADVAFVPSTFAMQTVDRSGVFTGTVVVVPHGPLLHVGDAGIRPRRVSKTLRVLYVGGLGLLDGVRYLLAACRRLSGAIDVTFVAPPSSELAPAAEDALTRHRWIPSCTPDRLLDEMTRHDVLVLPSLFEGFGRPLLEAMASGLPIVATDHTAAPDLIDDGVQGYVVPIRDADAIAEKLDLLRREPDLCATMGHAARRRATEFSWENYRASLAACTAVAIGG